MSGTSASVLFSGGSDSTLAAALMLERCDQVHLLTCSTSVMFRVERAAISAQRLRDRYGAERVIPASLDCNAEFDTLYRGDYRNDVRQFGPYVTACVCAACSLSWHVRAIAYDVQHGVTRAADGERWEDPPIWAEQMPSVLEAVRGLYAEHGIAYENPVYRIDRTDWELHDRGLSARRDTKIEGLKDGEGGFAADANRQWKSGQPNCHGGILGAIYLSCYLVPREGQPHNEALALAYYAKKIPVARELVRSRLEREGTTAVAGV